MGVPKFFRYISERYPCLSEIVREYQIPEFDNLYLDMNGIIHMCSHPDDGDPHFRISEERIFIDIFHYIEVLFRMIKPRKLFFMAVDGVAPRAKMNQQRGRRFRSAKEAQVLEAKAIEKGEELPTEARFDSNCITPGTVFMARLQEQLKYFVVHKITVDKMWKDCKIILSGHETPGEGEHKIMDYIRYMRAQPGYDPNTRHCLYGLDADLIMLGLCTHEPHFSLLREEVRFGKKSNKRKNIPEQITFYLLHLSLMREYLELEFLPLKDSLKFEYNMESIIDDWVLMGFLVGNDFIPHLPNMHIDNGALPVLYKAYMKVLPQIGGYINESGILNLERFELFVKELGNIDIQNFTEKYADLKWFEAKTGKLNEKKAEIHSDHIKGEEDGAGKTNNSELADLIQATDDLLIEKHNSEDECEDNVPSDYSEEENLFQAEFLQHKTDYYMNKLQYENVTQEVLKSQAEEYVRAIQWNLHYYYNGVCSWSWYYQHHYAPYISDIKDFSHLTFEFELGQPFKPYEQLLAVLPAASKILLPLPYQELMTEENSPIKMYYPEDFQTDLNGKRQEWEAVVLIPFIEEDVLLKAMEPCNQRLNAEETARNTHGPMLLYQYTPETMEEYVAPQYFPNIKASHAKCENIFIEDIRVRIDKLVKGAYPGAKFDVYYPGFPTMKHLDYVGRFKKAKVRVFEQPSRGENLMLLIIQDDDIPTPDAIAKDLLGKTVHVGWPHLQEAMVVSVSCDKYRYNSTGQVGQYNVEEIKGNCISTWDAERQAITDHYNNRLGVDVGLTEVLVHVKVMIGRKYMFTNEGRVTLDKQWADIASSYPLQTIVRDITVHEEKYVYYKNIEDVYPIGSHCFMLGQPHYGVLGEVLDSKETLKNGRIKLSIKKEEEPDLTPVIDLDNEISVRFINIHVAATKLAISKKLFGRITGSVYLVPRKLHQSECDDVPKSNIGLNLKFNKKNEEVPGYTRKEGNTWYYSSKAMDLVSSYMNEFPLVFEYLNYHVGNDIFEENQMFPDGDAKEQIRSITTWIKKQPYYSIERQVCGSYVIDPEAIQLLERVVDDFNKNNSKLKQLVMQVKPHLLYKNSLQMGNLMPDSAATFQLYDRVINVREGYTVPMGFKGTIVGIHNSSNQNESETTFDVLFDQEFAGGLSINTSSNRGYRMSKLALINISYGIRALEQKSGKPGQYQNMQSKIFPNNNYNNYNTMGSQPNMLNYPNSRFPPPNSMFTNWSQGCNFPTQPSAATNFNPFNYNQQPNSNGPAATNFNPFNYNQQPNSNGPYNYPIRPPFGSTGSYNQPGPHSFVPYKNNNFSTGSPGTSPHYVSNNRPPATDSKNNVRKDTSNKASYKDHFVPTQIITPSANNNKLSESNMLPQWTENSGNSNSSRRELRNSLSDNTSVLTAEDIFAHARAKDQHSTTQKQTAEIPKSDNMTKDSYHTAKLLTEFQARDLGRPSYQYFKLNGGDTFIATIMMPDGSSIIGESANSKDQAAEHAATKALASLTKDEQINTIVPVSSTEPVPPKPPKQWHNTQYNTQTSPQTHWSKRGDSQEKWRSEKQENWRVPNTPPSQNRMKVNPALIHKHLSFDNTAGKEKKQENAAAVSSSSSFVPLQAVRQHRNRTSSASTTDNTLSENKNPNRSSSQKQDETVHVERSVNDTANNTSTKPKRERKMRIAANFQVSMAPK